MLSSSPLSWLQEGFTCSGLISGRENDRIFLGSSIKDASSQLLCCLWANNWQHSQSLIHPEKILIIHICFRTLVDLGLTECNTAAFP